MPDRKGLPLPTGLAGKIGAACANAVFLATSRNIPQIIASPITHAAEVGTKQLKPNRRAEKQRQGRPLSYLLQIGHSHVLWGPMFWTRSGVNVSACVPG